MEIMDIEQMLKSGSTVQFHPMGGSMWPIFITAADEAVVSPVTRPLRRGDVCVFRGLSGRLVIHRLCRIEEDGLYFAGDHQITLEGPIEKSAVIGIMTDFVRRGHRYSVKNPVYSVFSKIWMLVLPHRFRLIDFGSRIKHLIK